MTSDADESGYFLAGEAGAELAAKGKRGGAAVAGVAGGSVEGYGDVLVTHGDRREVKPSYVGQTDDGKAIPATIGGADGKPVPTGTITQRFRVRTRGGYAVRGGSFIGPRYEPFYQSDAVVEITYADANGDGKLSPGDPALMATGRKERFDLPDARLGRSVDATLEGDGGKRKSGANGQGEGSGRGGASGSFEAVGNTQRGATTTDVYTVDLKRHPEVTDKLRASADDAWRVGIVTTQASADGVVDELAQLAGPNGRHDHYEFATTRRQNNQDAKVGATPGALVELNARLHEDNIQISQKLVSGYSDRPVFGPRGVATSPPERVNLTDGPGARCIPTDPAEKVSEPGGQFHSRVAVSVENLRDVDKEAKAKADADAKVKADADAKTRADAEASQPRRAVAVEKPAVTGEVGQVSAAVRGGISSGGKVGSAAAVQAGVRTGLRGIGKVLGPLGFAVDLGLAVWSLFDDEPVNQCKALPPPRYVNAKPDTPDTLALKATNDAQINGLFDEIYAGWDQS